MQIIAIKTPTVALYSQVNIAWHFVDVSEVEVQCDGDYFFSLLGQFYVNGSNKARLWHAEGWEKKTGFIYRGVELLINRQ